MRQSLYFVRVSLPRLHSTWQGRSITLEKSKKSKQTPPPVRPSAVRQDFWPFLIFSTFSGPSCSWPLRLLCGLSSVRWWGSKPWSRLRWSLLRCSGLPQLKEPGIEIQVRPLCKKLFISMYNVHCTYRPSATIQSVCNWVSNRVLKYVVVFTNFFEDFYEWLSLDISVLFFGKIWPYVSYVIVHYFSPNCNSSWKQVLK